MIKGITASSPYINVNGGQPGSIYVNLSGINPATGTVRVNGQDLEVFDGNVWQRFAGNYADVSLNQEAVRALDWVRDKMEKETRIKELAAKNPTVEDALRRFEEAQAQLEMVLTLTDTQ
jgi:ABC-type cobalamin transport system ATPase subunit